MNQRMFGPYRIEELLGRGGMGEVYRAFDTEQNRQVAIKLLLPGMAADPHYTARFRRESEVAARLREPHVIPIHRYGEIDGQLFIDMRLVEGADLADALADGPLPPETAVSVVEQVAAALAAAHADGLIHRDVKPSNVLCAGASAPTDFVYLVDFGIARTVGSTMITTAGTAIGSVDYMAPERFSAAPLDHRIDVYSLACLLFECLTARKPYVAGERIAVVKMHLQDPPPVPSQVQTGVPTGFDEVVARGMAKSPDDRYQAIGELAAAARAALGTAAAAPVPAPAAAPSVASSPTAATGWWTRTNAGAPPATGQPAPAPWWRRPSTTAGAQSGGGAPAGPASGTPAARPAGFAWRRPGAAAAPQSWSPPAAAAPVEPPRPSGTRPYTRAVPPGAPGRGGQWWDRSATALHPVAAPSLTIGRAADCDIVLTDPLVSRQHARLTRDGDRWQLTDLRSWNGTFVNGQRVTRAVIDTDDVIGIGHALLHLQGGTLVEYTDHGDISFEAEDLVVTRSGKRLLDGVGFALPQRSLLAVVGPSGAGKSTLLGALTGQRPADTGEVRYAGRDLYDSYDELRQRIGLVPQDDILHPQLTVRRALRYAAQLRFPADTPAKERNDRVEEVIDELGLTGQAGQRISTLSGGQRKRTSVALELLTRPSLLFLDEPTSGLDPGMDKSVMQTLRALADDGRTVVVVTHSPAQLEMCDRLLVLASGGKLAYFGPPDEALTYFGQADFADMFLLLDRNREVDWTGRFKASPYYARYGAPATTTPPERPARSAPAPAPRQQPALRQFAVLARRYLAVIAADRVFALVMLLMPVVLALIAMLIPAEHGLSVESWRAAGFTPNGDPLPRLLVLVVMCCFMGFAASFRELVKERSIFHREQSIGLSIGAYLASKLVVLAVIAGVQAVLLTVIALAGAAAPPRPVVFTDGKVEIAVVLVLVAVAIMVQGLLVSALIANADQGMPVLVVVLLLQFVLSEFFLSVHGKPGLDQLTWLVPARWGLAATSGATVGRGTSLTEGDRLWEHTAGAWTLDVSGLLLLTAAGVLATRYVLRRRTRVHR
ncbi:protein kinase domain-containing protein [Pseudonocardia sp. CA-107938]|uniref:protein kinase domain-containing protein n=1 Tax=Pseudonocardia sp. CA-107938 TaxID=3240021 RepID=UPI003D8E08E3